MTPLLVLGTHSFAEEVADLISDNSEHELTGFVENMDLARCSSTLLEKPIIWVDDILPYISTHKAICGMGTTRRSRFADQVASLGMRFTTLLHPTARISKEAVLDEGTIVSVACIIATRTHLGRHTVVNRGSIIGHHVKIGDYVSIMSGANIGGNSTIGSGTYIGMSAVILNNIKIGSGCIIGAGAVVTKDLPDRVQAVGIPARIVKEDIDPL